MHEPCHCLLTAVAAVRISVGRSRLMCLACSVAIQKAHPTFTTVDFLMKREDAYV